MVKANAMMDKAVEEREKRAKELEKEAALIKDKRAQRREAERRKKA